MLGCHIHERMPLPEVHLTDRGSRQAGLPLNCADNVRGTNSIFFADRHVQSRLPFGRAPACLGSFGHPRWWTALWNLRNRTIRVWGRKLDGTGRLNFRLGSLFHLIVGLPRWSIWQVSAWRSRLLVDKARVWTPVLGRFTGRSFTAFIRFSAVGTTRFPSIPVRFTAIELPPALIPSVVALIFALRSRTRCRLVVLQKMHQRRSNIG